jgi:ABC-2 type transport system ATP-binding protein
MTNSNDSVIEVKNLTKQFGADIAVDNINFSIPRGQLVGLLGGNGAGKTTTLSMLLGILVPTSGSINILGIDMSKNRHDALARMNFSSPYVDLPQRSTVRENLTVFSQLYSVKNYMQRIEQLTEDLEVYQFLDRMYGSLSAGQKTRVLLAKSLINTPELILMDEPTASLDPDTADWVREYIKKYQQQTNSTILMASHNMVEVERLCDDVIMMRSGKIVDRAAPKDLIAKYGRETMEEVFLDIARQENVHV